MLIGNKEIKRKILRYLLERERATSELPKLADIASDLEETVQAISDQIDIFESRGAVVANRTFGGGAAPMLTGSGKALLEELEEANAGLSTEVSPQRSSGPAGDSYPWDVFISHAFEDKEPFVRELAQRLMAEGARVWYDELSLKIGDSLRRSIDHGLSKSRFGIVVLSPRFFEKEWPQKELDGLTTREGGGQKVILPVWLDVERKEVRNYSPTLADRIAAKASDGMDKVVADLMDVIFPQVSERASVLEIRALAPGLPPGRPGFLVGPTGELYWQDAAGTVSSLS